jgi:cytidylate kinase
MEGKMKAARNAKGFEAHNQATADQVPMMSERTPLVPHHNLPKQMIVAIDGTAQSGKSTVAEIIAQAVGGVVVDSDRIYRALTLACLNAGVPLNDTERVKAFFYEITLIIRLGWDGGKAKEALPFVDGRLFSKGELKAVAAETWKVAAVAEIRKAVLSALRSCAIFGRVVMLGQNIGGAVFPKTPYKFFLDAPIDVREARHQHEFGYPGAAQRDSRDDQRILFPDDGLLIEGGSLNPEEVSGIILVEVFWRADENRFTGKRN